MLIYLKNETGDFQMMWLIQKYYNVVNQFKMRQIIFYDP